MRYHVGVYNGFEKPVYMVLDTSVSTEWKPETFEVLATTQDYNLATAVVEEMNTHA